MSSPALSVLEFAGARLRVRIGWSPEERARPQAVDLDAAVRFAAPPAGCETDALDDTVSYSALIDAARELVGAREFRLLERLAAELFARLRSELPADSELWLRVTKVRPPVDALRGGASFSLGDWQPAHRESAPR